MDASVPRALGFDAACGSGETVFLPPSVSLMNAVSGCFEWPRLQNGLLF